MKSIAVYVFCIAAYLGICSFVCGGGLETKGFGARGRSMGFALVAIADDWTSIYYNPAGIGKIKGSQFGCEYEFFTGSLDCTESLRNLASGGDPARGDWTDPVGDEFDFNEDSIGSDIHFGSFGFIYGGETFGWGIGLYGSGSGTAWEDDTGSLAGDSIEALVRYTNGSANIPVSFGWEVTPEVALGCTLGIHWGLLKIENTKERTGVVSYTQDFTQDTQGIALSLDAGVLWKIRDDLDFGAVIRFPYNFRKSGDTDLDVGLQFSSDTTVDMWYPLRVTVGCAWRPLAGHLLGFSISLNKWADYNMRTDYEDEVPTMLEDSSGNPANWRNAYVVNVGLERELNDKWLFRAGLTYDQAPEPEKNRILTGGQVIDVWLFSIGAGIDLGETVVDFGYIYTYAPKVSGYVPGAEYSMNMHEFFVGASWNF